LKQKVKLATQETEATQASLLKAAASCKLEIVFDTSNLEQSLKRIEHELTNWNHKLSALFEAHGSQMNTTTADSSGILKEVNTKLELESNAMESRMDELADIVNKMRDGSNSGVPSIFKDVSMSSNVAWSSPTLLCMKLREEYEQIAQEFSEFKSKLSQESTSIVEAHKEQTERIKDLTSHLSEMTQKYQREKEEKDSMITTLKNSERAVYDALKYKAALDEAAQLREKLDEVKRALVQEKMIHMNELFDAQMGIAKIAELTEEINRLTNTRTQLNISMQKLKETHELQLRTMQYELESLQAEKKLLLDKTVISILTSGQSNVDSEYIEIQHVEIKSTIEHHAG
jgi:DNA repair exonuclease SbcCD ATPase subunit